MAGLSHSLPDYFGLLLDPRKRARKPQRYAHALMSEMPATDKKAYTLYHIDNIE